MTNRIPLFRACAFALMLIAAAPAQRPEDDAEPDASSDAPSAVRSDAERTPGALATIPAPRPLEPFVPRQQPSETEQQRAHSLALFGKARWLFQQQRFEEALAAYQRAWFWNPDAATVLWEIVPLALHLDRQGTALRYAVLASELAPRDPRLMQQLALMLARDDQYERAIQLLDRALDQLAGQAKDGSWLELQFDRIRLCLLAEKYEDGVRSVDGLREALENPDRWGLVNSSIDRLLGEPALVYSVMAEVYLQAGRWQQAKSVYEKLHQLSQPAPIHAYHRARLALQASDLDAARHHLQSYFEAPSNTAGTEPYELLQKIFVRQKRSDDEFLTQIEELLRRDPHNRPLAHFVARQLLQRGQAAEARELLESLQGDQPTAEVLLDLLAANRQLQRPGAVIALWGQAVEVFGDLTILADEIDSLVANQSTTAQLLEEAHRRQQDQRRPMLASEALGVALFCLAAEKFSDGDAFFTHALELTTQADQRTALELLWAEECFFADHLTPAIRILDQALSRTSEEPTTTENLSEMLAMALELDGQTDRAIKVLDRELARTTGPSGLQMRRAWVLIHAGRPQEAQAAYRQAVTALEDDFSSETLRESLKEARMVLSNLHVEQQELEPAEELLLEVLDEFPEEVGAMNDLGYLWADQGKHLQRSLKMIQQAVVAEPDNAAYLDSLGWVYFRLGQTQDALSCLQQASERQDPADGIILDHLADVYASVGQTDKALATWRKALELLRTASAADHVVRIESKIKRQKAEDTEQQETE